MPNQAMTVFGIDLGTTYSCVAYVDEFGKAVIVPNAEGEYTTPSAVFFDGANRVVGKEAKNNALLFPEQVVEMVKRQMGVAEWRFPYEGVNYTAEEISSYILRKVVGDAEISLGRTIKDVVITCPAYFGITEKEATKKAGEIAGLNVLAILNEPTAAAISYGLHEQNDEVVLVYDLGGGTFDITMIDIKGGAFTVIATGGNHRLGGRQWDEITVNFLADQWMSESGSSSQPLDSAETLQDLFDKAERGKMALTSPRGYTDIPVNHGGQRVGVRLTREKFDELTANLLEQTIQHTRSTLAVATEKGVARFDEMLLVGGSTKMPQVAARIAAEFGVTPKFYEPDFAVAKGAAIYGQKLALDQQIIIKVAELTGTAPAPAGSPLPQVTPEVLAQARQEVANDNGLALPSVVRASELNIRTVTSRSFGVIALKRDGTQLIDIVSNIIKVQDQLPAQATQRFGTVEPNQPTVAIQFVEDLLREDEVEPSNSEEIGTATLNLPPNLPANSAVEISFNLDGQGLLQATARELTANRVVQVEIKTDRAISAEEYAEARSRSGKLVVS